MKYPGDIMYFLMYVGPDVLLAAIATVAIIFIASWYFLRRRKRKVNKE